MAGRFAVVRSMKTLYAKITYSCKESVQLLRS